MRFDAIEIPIGSRHRLLIAKAGLSACNALRVDQLPAGWRGIPGDQAKSPISFEASPSPGFQSIQLFENERYFLSVDPADASLEHSGFELEPVTGVTGKFHFRIASYLGTSWLKIADFAPVRFDVISRKMNYADEYRSMVEDIAGQCSQLLLDWDTPTSVSIKVDEDVQTKMLLEQFLFLHHSLGPDKLDLFLEILRRNPHLALEREYRWKEFGASPVGPSFFANPLAHSRDWGRAPTGVAAISGHAPRQLLTERKYDCADTPPNRFVKFALQTFHDLCDRVVNHRGIGIGRAHEGTASREALVMREYLEGILAEPFFQEVGRLTRLPLSSQPLQKREGYRDVLRAWLMLELAAQLDWEGREDAYDGTNRDVPTLYEYWLYFVLRAVLGKVNELEEIRLHEGAGDTSLKPFVTLTDGGLRINLKQGQASVSAYRWRTEDPDSLALRVHFYYNRSFSRQDVLSAGSYSRTFRPDYSLVIFPESFAGTGGSPRALVDYEKAAEEAGQIGYLHFDAKYRVEQLQDIFGKESSVDADITEELDQEHAESASCNTYKRGDLYKMHTYNEAIRRTVGSYVLYPGTDSERGKTFQRYHEPLPGVGAFAVRPVPNGDDELGATGISALADFIGDVMGIQRDRFSQLYRLKYWEHDTVKEKPIICAAGRIMHGLITPPADTQVLIGSYSTKHKAEECRGKGIFYYHAIDEKGQPVPLDTRHLSAKLIIPFVGSECLGWYARIESTKLVSRAKLAAELGVDADAFLGSDCNYYFLIRLSDITDGLPMPVVKPVRRRPRVVQWSELWDNA